jgi:tyrosyl-tRNA synthetase
LTVDEVDAIASGLSAGELHPNATKRRLAREIVALYHDAASAYAAEAAFDRIFKEHGVPDDVPEFEVDLDEEVYLPGLLHQLGLAPSASEGRRLIDGGGVRVDGESVLPRTYSVARAYVHGRLLQVGKRKYARPVSRT